MKKIFSLCSVVLAVSVLLTCLASCNGGKSDDNTTETTAASVESVSGFAAEIGDKEVTIKKDGKEFQTLKYPINPAITFDKNYAMENNEFIDMNFDGEVDYYIAVSSTDGVISYYCWLYNATSKQFDYSVMLSSLNNISVDSVNQRILSKVNNDGVEHVFSYKWVDGSLALDSDYNENNGGIPEEVTKVIAENSIGTEKTTASKADKETTKKETSDNKETTKKQTSGNKETTKVNRPANTTTTAPNKDSGIVLGNGGDINADGWY